MTAASWPDHALPAVGQANATRRLRIGEASSFLKYIDDNGHYAGFHALRSTFITNLLRANVSPNMAQDWPGTRRSI